jgi:molybdenum cofactor cytidylyltransferase
VTVGARGVEIRQTLAGLPLELIEGFDWREGPAAELRAATLWAMDRGAEALMVLSPDQPFLTTRHLNTLSFASEHGARLAASYYGGRAGVPAIFPARYFGSLLALRGDEDPQTVLRRETGAVCIAWPEGAIDVDTASEISTIH